MVYAPVLITTLNRYDKFKQCLESLSANTWADKTTVYIALDYPRKDEHWDGYNKIRELLSSKFNFEKLVVIEREVNYGPYKNFTSAIDIILERYDRFILSEDDNVFSKNFLMYMDKCLEKYENDDEIAAVCAGARMNIDNRHNSTVFRSVYYSPWGAGFWKRKYLNMVDFILSCRYQTKLSRWDFVLKNLLVAPKQFHGHVSTLGYDKMWVHDVTVRSYLISENKKVILPGIDKAKNLGIVGGTSSPANVDKKIIDWYATVLADESDVFSEITECENDNIANHIRMRKIGTGPFFTTYADILLAVTRYLKYKVFGIRLLPPGWYHPYNPDLKCDGCHACYSACPQRCITMRPDDEGFLYPKIDEKKCASCRICQKICPLRYVKNERTPIAAYAAKNRNVDIRRESSSGGIFTLLAEHTIGKGGVVFGARFNENREVEHRFAQTVEGLAAFRGSKYVQSKISDAYETVESFLKSGRVVLFSGTPCQVAGLKAFLRKDYGNQLVTVDFICHGVPSPLVWKKYLDEITDMNADMKEFLSDYYLRPSCYDCQFKSLRSGSDITIADFRGIENVLPEFDDDKGVSLVMVNTESGMAIYNTIDKEDKEVAYDNAKTYNPAVDKSTGCPAKRPEFFKMWQRVSVARLAARLTRSANRTAYFKKLGRIIIKRPIKAVLRRLGISKLIRNVFCTKRFN